MSDQPSLLDWTPAHQRHSPTSKAAAEAIRHRVGPMHVRILNYLLECGDGGCTDEELQGDIDMPANTQRPRRRELQQWGLVIDSGTTRKTNSGRQAVVWILRPDGV